MARLTRTPGEGQGDLLAFPVPITEVDVAPLDSMVPPEQRSPHVDPLTIRNARLTGALDYLDQIGRREGAVTLGAQYPTWSVTRAVDAEASGGIEGVKERKANLERGYLRRLAEACGACALVGQCDIGRLHGDRFKDKFRYSNQRNVLRDALRRDPATNCSTVRVPAAPRRRSK